MRTHTTFRIGLAVAAGAIIAGCANDTASPSSSAGATTPSTVVSPTPPAVPSLESTAPATRSPAVEPPTGKPLPTITLTDKPPKEPTDKQPNTGWVAGMVTRGGKGPCYGLIADDGQRYALYSTAGTELVQGARVKVKLETTGLRIYCGPGTLMAMTDAETVK
ncbi:hypothetical protein [Actinoplanes philippinensis]|uniref:hypothetical protein n=1 Tax=Actinoplanes philippinensis TaxID=35752 RepID=UPI0033C639D5